MQVKISILDHGAVVYGNPENASMRRMGAFSTVDEAVAFACAELKKMVANYPAMVAEQKRLDDDMRARIEKRLSSLAQNQGG